jgi:hypothetical protein
MAGNVMTRRALYQYGSLVSFDEKDNVGLGLGSAISLGTITLIAPTESPARSQHRPGPRRTPKRDRRPEHHPLLSHRAGCGRLGSARA